MYVRIYTHSVPIIQIVHINQNTHVHIHTLTHKPHKPHTTYTTHTHKTDKIYTTHTQHTQHTLYTYTMKHNILHHSYLTAKDWASESRGKASVVVAVEVAQKIGSAARNGSVAERIHCEGCSMHSLVEWA